jgi:hypothetical protein
MKINSIVLALSGLAFVSTAAAVDFQKEYEKKVQASQNVAALGDDLAGDQMNYLDGRVSFVTTDVSIPGNSALPVALSRHYSVDFDNGVGNYNFGDWTIDLPYISTVMTQDGWKTDSAHPFNRCSEPGSGAPPTVQVESPDFPAQHWLHGYYAQEYWHGYSLHVGGGEQALLLPTTANTVRPQNGKTYLWTTNKDWWLSCLAATANSGGGEGFEAIAPDGTTFRFDQMIANGADTVTATDDLTEGGIQKVYHTELPRAEYRLYVSKVTDRFGNWVSYNWTGGSLDSITSSDGRTITITHETSSRISYVSDGTRTWHYEYAIDPVTLIASLSVVTLPDGSAWHYSLGAVSNMYRPDMSCANPGGVYFTTWDCFGGGGYNSPVRVNATVIHPSGAQVDFVFDAHYQPSTANALFGSMPLGMVSKTITGPGLSPSTWKYGVGPSAAAMQAACKTGNAYGSGCLTYVMTDEIKPDGEVVRRLFDMQGRLRDELRGNSASAPSAGTPALTTSINFAAYLDDPSPVDGSIPIFYAESEKRYAPDTGMPYLVQVGVNPLMMGDAIYVSERRLPVQTQVQTLQGATFTRSTGLYDAFAQPKTVTRSSAGLVGSASGYSRTDLFEYTEPNTAKWVIEQPTKVTASGIVVSQTDYDSASLLPATTYSFGAVVASFEYASDGTLTKVTDGNGKATTLANWKRGVPQLITFPTTKTMKAVVDDIGNLSSTTDSLQSQTSYGYDLMGRLANIAYPTDVGTPAWADTTRSFVQVNSTELGLDPGHWKQTVKTGNGWTTTYYDGRWNPVLSVSEDVGNGTATKSFVVRRFDALGRETFHSYPLASATTTDTPLGLVTEYDALGRPYRVKQDSDPVNGNPVTLTTLTEYLPGYRTRVTNPRNAQTTASFQVFDQPSTEAPVLILAPQGVTTTINRDVFGKPLSITRSGPGA